MNHGLKKHISLKKKVKNVSVEESMILNLFIMKITSLLVSKATEQLNTQFYGEIFLAISDHIAFAIKRKKENIDLPNVVLSETKALYKKEYQWVYGL